MALELFELAVHRQEILRVRQGEHEFLLFLAGMAGNMGVVHVFVDDLGAQGQQSVDDLGDRLFVAGDGAGRDDDEVAGADLDVAVAGLGHAGQCREGFALAARGDEDDLLRRILVDLLNVDQDTVRHMQITKFLGHLGIGDHAAAIHRDFAARLDGQVDDLLDTVNIGRKSRHDDALVPRPGKQAANPLGDGLFRGGKAGTLGVGGICQQSQHAAAAVLGNGGEVGHGIPGKRGVVDLEVAGMDYDTRWALDGKGQGVRDGVIDMDGLHREAAETDLLTGTDLHKIGAGRKAVLFQLVADQADGQLGRIDGHIELAQQIGQAADVVLVAVGNEDTLDAVLVFQYIGEVGDDQVNAEHIGIREHQTAVHQDHVALAFIQGNVLADFAQTAQRADVHGNGRGIRLHVLAAASAGRAGLLRLNRLDRLLCIFSRLLSRRTAGTLRTGTRFCVVIPGGLSLLCRSGSFRRRLAAGTALGCARILVFFSLTFLVEFFH